MLPHLIAWVESRGADSASIRPLLGTADLTDPDLRLPEASVESAWQVAAALTHEDAIGVHLAEFLPRGALDLVESSTPSERVLLSRLDLNALHDMAMWSAIGWRRGRRRAVMDCCS